MRIWTWTGRRKRPSRARCLSSECGKASARQTRLGYFRWFARPMTRSATSPCTSRAPTVSSARHPTSPIVSPSSASGPIVSAWSESRCPRCRRLTAVIEGEEVVRVFRDQPRHDVCETQISVPGCADVTLVRPMPHAGIYHDPYLIPHAVRPVHLACRLFLVCDLIFSFCGDRAFGVAHRTEREPPPDLCIEREQHAGCTG
mmetsp:Transcript_13613/g.44478  ORF Transcript_13613/g.44478 Transcript_13613/m.44478 type:complete len:201 (-) Transcript_13613:299-901(-)